jgi:hypothetical protein
VVLDGTGNNRRVVLRSGDLRHEQREAKGKGA